MDVSESDRNAVKLLADARSRDPSTRNKAISELGPYIDYPGVRARLEEIMVGDEIVTMRVDAAEQLVRYGGEDGLLAVLGELGSRREDPDTDYTFYMLSELDEFGEYPVLGSALSIDESKLSPDVKIALVNLRKLTGK